MQFGGALPEHLDIAAGWSRRPPRADGAPVRARAQRVELALQRLQRKRQASPWLRDELLQNRERRRGAVVRDMLGNAEQRRRVPEAGRPRSGSAPPRLRMPPGLSRRYSFRIMRQPKAIEVLLCSAPRRRSRPSARCPASAATASRRKSDRRRPRRSGSRPRAASRRRRQIAEIGRGCGAVHEADVAGRAAPGRRRRAGVPRPPGPPRRRAARNRLPLAVRNSTATRGQQEPSCRPGSCSVGEIEHAERSEMVDALAGEPAPRRDEARNDGALEGGALASLQHRVGRAGEHEGEQFGRRRADPTRGFFAGAGVELEPVEAVGRQRQQIGQVADRREGAAARHLHRRAALELGEVKLDRLRRARQVRRRRGCVSSSCSRI